MKTEKHIIIAQGDDLCQLRADILEKLSKIKGLRCRDIYRYMYGGYVLALTVSFFEMLSRFKNKKERLEKFKEGMRLFKKEMEENTEDSLLYLNEIERFIQSDMSFEKAASMAGKILKEKREKDQHGR